MIKPVLAAILLWLCYFPLLAQPGCTDPASIDYNPGATVNNGSCTYAITNAALPLRARLTTQVNETSGLVYLRGDLWTMNDSGNPAAIYKIEQNTGNVLRTVPISNASNVDWEDITADELYLYIGDFGNNISGNRQNLRIYKIKIADLYADPVLSISAEIINFSYSDQLDFSPKANNSTEFDCEAFFVKNNQLHLFSKDWIGPQYQTKHYILSTTPGTHTAMLMEEFNVNGAITGADISKDNQNEIALIGYHPTNGSLFMWLLFDYQNDIFFSGNKRRIELGSGIQYGQIEGVTYMGEGVGYISSEFFSRTQFGFTITVPASLYTFTSVNWVPLPIDLINFRVLYTAPDVHISWQTTSQTDTDYFALERAGDGVAFAEIHRQPAAGLSRSVLSYSFTDKNPISNTSYYRLKQVDRSGKFTYSAVQFVQSGNMLPRIEVSPVPVIRGEAIDIRLEGYLGHIQIYVINLEGQTIIQESYSSANVQPYNLPTTNLQPGIYILKVVCAQEVLTRKILVL